MTSEILVIDDNPDIRNLITALLKDNGFNIREAANFDQATLEIKKKLPDVAVIDVKLDKSDNDGIVFLTSFEDATSACFVVAPIFIFLLEILIPDKALIFLISIISEW